MRPRRINVLERGGAAERNRADVSGKEAEGGKQDGKKDEKEKKRR